MCDHQMDGRNCRLHEKISSVHCKDIIASKEAERLVIDNCQSVLTNKWPGTDSRTITAKFLREVWTKNNHKKVDEESMNLKKLLPKPSQAGRKWMHIGRSNNTVKERVLQENKIHPSPVPTVSLPFSEVGFSRLLFCSVSLFYAMVAAKKTVSGPSTPCLFVCFSRFNCVSSPCTYFFSFSFSVHSFFYISLSAVRRVSFPCTMPC